MILVEKEGCVEKVVGKEGALANRTKKNSDPEVKNPWSVCKIVERMC